MLSHAKKCLVAQLLDFTSNTVVHVYRSYQLAYTMPVTIKYFEVVVKSFCKITFFIEHFSLEYYINCGCRSCFVGLG